MTWVDIEIPSSIAICVILETSIPFQGFNPPDKCVHAGLVFHTGFVITKDIKVT